MIVKPNKIKTHPPTITDEQIAKVIADIKRGAPKKYACYANGMSDRHFYYMVDQGKCDIRHGNLMTREARMVRSLHEVEMEAIVSCCKDIRKNKQGHKGAQWILEHVYWREFSGDAKIMTMAEELEKLKMERLDEKRSKEGHEEGNEEDGEGV